MNYKLETNQLSFGYDQKKILKEIDLQIKEGLFVSIVGPNGSGKSTFLKNISRIIDPEKNSVFLDGKDIRELKPKALSKELAILNQSSHFEYDFTSLDIVLMGRNPHIKPFSNETKKDYEICLNAMKLTDTTEFKDRPINSLSGGERQRVLLARSIAQETDILLLDEPITYLDINHQIDILKIIRSQTKDNNQTVVSVLHDLNLAIAFSDEIVVLKEGKIFAKGVPEDIVTEEMISEVYGIDVDIVMKNNKPYIIPLY